jgi:hypothetical protein
MADFRLGIPSTAIPKIQNVAKQAKNSLIGETMINRQVPSRSRIMGSVKGLAKNFIRNPIKTVKQGFKMIGQQTKYIKV